MASSAACCSFPAKKSEGRNPTTALQLSPGPSGAGSKGSQVEPGQRPNEKPSGILAMATNRLIGRDLAFVITAPFSVKVPTFLPPKRTVGGATFKMPGGADRVGPAPAPKNKIAKTKRDAPILMKT